MEVEKDGNGNDYKDFMSTGDLEQNVDPITPTTNRISSDKKFQFRGNSSPKPLENPTFNKSFEESTPRIHEGERDFISPYESNAISFKLGEKAQRQFVKRNTLAYHPVKEFIEEGVVNTESSASKANETKPPLNANANPKNLYQGYQGFMGRDKKLSMVSAR